MTGGEVILRITALLGVLSLVWVAVCLTFGLSFVTFRTGSMSPTMPTGTLALVQRAAAAELRMGDVVTVQRSDELPITHRVVAMETAADPRARVLSLQGDANTRPDDTRYTVRTVQKVIAWVPGAARIWTVLHAPATMGLALIALGGLMTWVLLPGRRDRGAAA